MARMISAVTANRGMAGRIRSMRMAIPKAARSQERTGRRTIAGPFYSSGLEAFDVVPQRAILAPVGRPDLLLRHLSEIVDLGFHYGHAQRLELRLGLGEIVDGFGGFANLLLSRPREVHHQLLLIGRQAVPDLEI